MTQTASQLHTTRSSTPLRDLAARHCDPTSCLRQRWRRKLVLLDAGAATHQLDTGTPQHAAQILDLRSYLGASGRCVAKLQPFVPK